MILEEEMMRQARTPCLLSAVVLAVMVNTSHADVYQWAIGDGGNGHFYEPMALSACVTWFEANDLATAAGGYLVTLTSDAENNFVFDLIDDDAYWWSTGVSVRGPWTGGLLVDQQWTWVTGEPFSYTSWGIGQPGPADVQSAEDCIHYDQWGDVRMATWNDMYRWEAATHSYVIEYETNPAVVPVPGAFLLGVLGLGTASWHLRRRKAS